MSRTTTAFLFACMLLLAPAHALADAGPEPRPPGAAIASAHALATEAGFETLRAGGNAFDAAVTVSAVLSVVEPISSGLGGGGFFLLHDAGSGRDVFVDARETSPAAATPDRYIAADDGFGGARRCSGPRSAAIPGLPSAFVHAAGHYGQLLPATWRAGASRIAGGGSTEYARMARGDAGQRELI